MDYDIDKAYIMGQSYDSNATYVKWSPYFDYTSLKTLEASKKLPVPKGYEVMLSEDGADITDEMRIFGNLLDIDPSSGEWSLKDLSEEEKVLFLNTLAAALKKVDKSLGKYSPDGTISNELSAITEQLLNRHETYAAPDNIAEAAYKNVASANIYVVSHDIRNRDQAYTAISMDQMRAAAENSPKGEQAALLNMLNPLTKYIMQYQNLVGKDVIGIAANGEKFWFNIYYYWTQVLKDNDESKSRYLQFETTLSRVKGRAQALWAKDLSLVSKRTTTHIPDLDIRDPKIATQLFEKFGATEESVQYRYTDLLVSELLSSATDEKL